MQFKSILVTAAAFLFSGIASAAPPADPGVRELLASLPEGSGDESCITSCRMEAPWCMWGLTAVIPMTGLEPCTVKCCAFPQPHEP